MVRKAGNKPNLTLMESGPYLSGYSRCSFAHPGNDREHRKNDKRIWPLEIVIEKRLDYNDSRQIGR